MKNQFSRTFHRDRQAFTIDRKQRFKYKTLLAAILTTTLFVIICAVSFYYVYQNSLVDELVSSNGEILDRTDSLISETYSQIESLALQLSLDAARQINKSDDDITHDYYRLQSLTNSLINLKNANGYIHSCYIYFNQGNLILTSFMGITSYSLFYDTEWYSYYRTHANEIGWIDGRKPYDASYENNRGPLLRHNLDMGDVCTLLVPLPETSRARGGVIIVNVYERKLGELLFDRDSPFKTYLTNKEGRITLSSEAADAGAAIAAELKNAMDNGTDKIGRITISEDGQKMLYLFKTSRIAGRNIITSIPLGVILRPTQDMLRSVIILSCVLLIVACALVYMIFRRSVKPFILLLDAIRSNLELHEYGLADENDLQAQLVRIMQDNKRLTKLWENNRVVIRHRTLSLLLQGHFMDNDDFYQRLSYLEIRFPHPLFICVLIRLDVPQKSHALLDDKYEIIKMQLFPLIQNCIPRQDIGYTVDIDDLNIAVILNLEEEIPGTLLKFCKSVRQIAVVSKLLPYTLSFGIGKCVRGVGNLSESFQSARSAVDYATSLGGDEAISFSSISLNPPSETQPSANNSVPQTLLSAIRLSDGASASEALNDIFRNLQRRNAGLDDMKLFAIRLCNQIVSLLLENGIPADDATELADASRIAHIGDPAGLEKLLLKMIENACARVQAGREHKKIDIMENVINYVKDNYMKDITVTQMAETVYMSVPYFCKVFKEYTNKTFLDYLTALRVDASIDLLAQSNDRVFEISSSVGFTNVQAYIRAFKKRKKMTPTEYRSNICAGNLKRE